MNERIMQFRLGMFVIVAGLVLTMMIIWFGESPSLFRDQVYITARFDEAPGVAEGIPVRKSGIRIGEVASIRFDERPNHPDSVLVTLAIDRKYRLRAGSVPRISRALIGDVAIDMLPGSGPGWLPVQTTPALPPDRQILNGTIAPDPSKAMEAATAVMQDVQGTLNSIDLAAKNLSAVAKRANRVDEFLASWIEMGHSVKTLATDFDRVVSANEADLRPTIANLRDLSEKFNATFDPQTQANLRAAVTRFSAASDRLDKVFSALQPLANDLGTEAGRPKTTDFGQVLVRLNRIAFDLSLLTSRLNDGANHLNPNGTLQQLLLRSDLYDNLNQMAILARDAAAQAKPAMGNFNAFSSKLAKDPSLLMKGALSR
ncbi:MAG: MCE family protein [Isosphaeraceae bacterium]|nr:MCE family protein [Isosphaeraceae bacterium]